MTARARLAALLVAAALLAGCGRDRYPDALLIGHRGDILGAPENSLAGFDLAYANGADGVEFDVQLTRDGRNVVMHDETLERTTSCTGLVRDHTVAELRACTLANGEPIVPLDEMLADIADLFTLVFLEIKVAEDPVPPAEEVLAQVDDVAATVLASGWAERVVVISYDETALRHLGELRARGLVAGWDDRSTDSVSDAHRFGLAWVLMPLRILEPWVGDVVRGLGHDLAVYDVVTPNDLVRAMQGGSRAFMVDDVSAFAVLLDRDARPSPVRPARR